MKKAYKLILIINIVFVLGCNKNPTELDSKLQVSNKQLAKDLEPVTKNKSNYSIKDIPLKITDLDNTVPRGNQRLKKVKANLKQAGMGNLLSKNKKFLNESSIVNNYRVAVAENKLDGESFEAASIIILRDYGLLLRTEKSDKEFVAIILKKLINNKSKNLALQYFALRSLNNFLSNKELSILARNILANNNDEKTYQAAVELKNRMVKKLSDGSESSLKINASRPPVILNHLNSIIMEHEFYQSELKKFL